MKCRIIRSTGWLSALGAFLVVALSASPTLAQGFRRSASLRPMPRQTAQSFNSAFNAQLGARNPYFTYNNQMQLLQPSSAQGGINYGTWQNQALMNSLAAQTYGTNYGIPFNYSTVASYYAPYFNPYYYTSYPSYPLYAPPVVNPYAPSGLYYPAGGPWSYP